MQIVRYPSGGGQLRDHVDSRKNQRVVSGIVMSKRGIDYEKGGFYFNKSKNKRINLESRIDEGDAVIFYGSLVHGVEAIDPDKALSWKSNKGRWFLGMFVNDSDHVKNRITSEDLTGSIKKKNSTSTKMTILISGASGQVGSDLVRNLSKSFKIIAIYNSKKKKINKKCSMGKT